MKTSSTFISCILSLIISVNAFSQLTMVVTSIPESTPPGDDIYIGGTFNSWNPGDTDYILQGSGEGWVIVLDSMPPGTHIEYKFTRGSWDKVEKGPNGEEIANRTYIYGNGDTVNHEIATWADQGGGGQSTAAENVVIMDEDFYMPQLDRTRRIWLYLPPDYDESTEHYPVLYMHDGQNLFDESTAFLGEWHVDETLNELATEGYKVPIVVGIDNGGALRIDEYTPWEHPQHGGGDGELYVQFIVETLKPYIDENYRTRPEPANTGIMGSSLGGLISHYAVIAYQDVFYKGGIFSPSYWFSDSVWSFTSQTGGHSDLKIYQMCGSMEGVSTIQNMQKMNDTLLQYGLVDEGLMMKIIPGGEHNEQLWAQDFREAYLWLFSDYTFVDEDPSFRQFKVYPNPSTDIVTIPHELAEAVDTLEAISMTGDRFLLKFLSHNHISVAHLPAGGYILLATRGDVVYQARFVKIDVRR